RARGRPRGGARLLPRPLAQAPAQRPPLLHGRRAGRARTRAAIRRSLLRGHRQSRLPRPDLPPAPPPAAGRPPRAGGAPCAGARPRPRVLADQLRTQVRRGRPRAEALRVRAAAARMSGRWIPVGRPADLRFTPGAAVRVEDRWLAIFPLDGGYVALDNSCPRAGAPLCDGSVLDGKVVCYRHLSEFDLRTR